MEHDMSRGVSRTEMEHQDNHQSMMDPKQKMEMLKMHHMQTLWIYWVVILLGLWVLLSPLTFDTVKIRQSRVAAEKYGSPLKPGSWP